MRGFGHLRLARYVGGGRVDIFEEGGAVCPSGGLLVRSEACGLCSGELMEWYMDRKVPHVLGHEVAGVVVESEDVRFPVGCRVAPHHHAPCMRCDLCERGAYVHCPTWKSTRLLPGGMAEFFGVSPWNLSDCHRVDDLSPRDAALVEPLACVVKQLRRVGYRKGECSVVVGLGVMGLLHALLMPGCVAYDLSAGRVDWARGQGVDARMVEGDLSDIGASCVVVCPGSEGALNLGLSLAGADARVGLFAPLPPGKVGLDLEGLYMRDVQLVSSYSCGPDDTSAAVAILRSGAVRAEQVVSDFISLEELPEAYGRMKRGEILKAMVEF